MPTVVRQFPEQPRSGTQETPWAQLPASKTGIRLLGLASDAVLSDPANAIDFTVLSSPDGTDANVDNRELQREYWTGGTHVDKVSGLTVSNVIDIGFNLQARYANGYIALRARFHDAVTGEDKSITVGAQVIALP